MKIITSALAALLFTFIPAQAEEKTEAPAKPYPLTTCIVSGEKLGAMGKPVAKVKDGQEVKFCCKACIEDFDADPAKFLKDMAEKAKK